MTRKIKVVDAASGQVLREEYVPMNHDHDTLIEVVGLLNNHVNNFNEHTKSFKDHEMRDQANFDSLRIDVLKIQKVIYIATGMILAVEALPTILKLMHILNK